MESTSAGYAIPLVLGVAVYYFEEDLVHARRFGSVTDGSRSSETGGIALRLLGLLPVAVGITDFVQTYVML